MPAAAAVFGEVGWTSAAATAAGTWMTLPPAAGVSVPAKEKAPPPSTAPLSKAPAPSRPVKTPPSGYPFGRPAASTRPSSAAGSSGAGAPPQGEGKDEGKARAKAKVKAKARSKVRERTQAKARANGKRILGSSTGITGAGTQVPFPGPLSELLPSFILIVPLPLAQFGELTLLPAPILPVRVSPSSFPVA